MDKIIMDTSDDAARFETDLTGWVDRNGIFFGIAGESTARYNGCTHRACQDCGKPTPKAYTACAECREKAAISRYEKLDRVEWDESRPVYSQSHDRYFNSWDEIADTIEGDLDNGIGYKSLRLVVCAPVYLRPIDTDYWNGDLPDEEYTFPDEIIRAIDDLNAALVEAGPVAWYPTKKAVKIMEEHEPEP